MISILLSGVWRVNQSDAMCELIYWFDLGYICSSNSVLSRHSVFAILRSSVWWVNQSDTLSYIFYRVSLGLIFYLTSDESRHPVLNVSMGLFGVHLVIDWWLNQKLCDKYFMRWNQNYFIIANISISPDVPSIDFWLVV